MRIALSMVLKSLYTMEEFTEITADKLLFGYEEQLTRLAHKFYPRGKRPPAKMGLLIGVSNIKVFLLFLCIYLLLLCV